MTRWWVGQNKPDGKGEWVETPPKVDGWPWPTRPTPAPYNWRAVRAWPNSGYYLWERRR